MRVNRRCEASLIPRRRGGQFGAISNFAGLTTPAAPSKEASRYFIECRVHPSSRRRECL